MSCLGVELCSWSTEILPLKLQLQRVQAGCKNSFGRRAKLQTKRGPQVQPSLARSSRCVILGAGNQCRFSACLKDPGAQLPNGFDADQMLHIQNMRVVQRNLVYVVGLALEICYEDALKGPEYFGQYGKIVKVSSSNFAAGEH